MTPENAGCLALRLPVRFPAFAERTVKQLVHKYFCWTLLRGTAIAQTRKQLVSIELLPRAK
jgi:hypothetical protein